VVAAAGGRSPPQPLGAALLHLGLADPLLPLLIADRGEHLQQEGSRENKPFQTK
jgi:hypothetical protein